MGGSTEKPKITKKDLEAAQASWGKFTQATKWSVIATAVILLLMAATLL